MDRLTQTLRSIKRVARWLEDAFLVTILGTMVLFAASQIVLRNFFGLAFFWGDELLRLLVLWLAVAGGVAASRAGRHIGIAVLDRYLSGRAAGSGRFAIHAFTSIVCGMVAWVSFEFVRTSREFGDLILGQVPAWWMQAALPAGFALMAWHHAMHATASVRGLFRPEAES